MDGGDETLAGCHPNERKRRPRAGVFRFPRRAAIASYARRIDAGATMANELLATQVMQALARGDKIGAVKLVRQAGVGSLREAMQYVEVQAASRAPAAGETARRAIQGAGTDLHGLQAHARSAAQALQAHTRTPTVVMGETPGQLRWVMIVLGLLALAAWLALGRP